MAENGPESPIVRLQSVSKTFSNGTKALHDLDLEIAAGDFVSLLGPSGCGKSTALRIIAGLGEASSGTVEWPQAKAASSGKPAVEIGFVFQEPTLMPWATVADNVWLPLRLRKQSRVASREAVMDALTQVGLENFADSYPRELSGGMKMRVSIARALVTHPEMLLMDEPFAALDEITRQKLNDDLIALWERIGCTIIFVTHSVFESVYLSQRIVVMAARPGRVVGDMRLDKDHESGLEFRTSAHYGELCRKVSRALADAMGGEGGHA